MRRIAVALLVLVAVVHFAPEHIAAATGASQTALEYVFRGAQGAVLFGAVAIAFRSIIVALPCSWGGVESAAQPMCRLAFPMDRPPPVPRNVNLCTAAFGEGTALAGLMMALVLVTAFALLAFKTGARG